MSWVDLWAEKAKEAQGSKKEKSRTNSGAEALTSDKAHRRKSEIKRSGLNSRLDERQHEIYLRDRAKEILDEYDQNRRRVSELQIKLNQELKEFENPYISLETALEIISVLTQDEAISDSFKRDAQKIRAEVFRDKDAAEYVSEDLEKKIGKLEAKIALDPDDLSLIQALTNLKAKKKRIAGIFPEKKSIDELIQDLRMLEREKLNLKDDRREGKGVSHSLRSRILEIEIQKERIIQEINKRRYWSEPEAPIT